jgi:hypothetical protein
VKVARWAHRMGVRAVKCGLQAVYFWPEAGFPGVDSSGQLTVSRVGHDVRVSSTGPELMRLMQEGCHDYLSLDLAKLYHGIVKRDALVRVRDTAGQYFGGLSPDIYAAVALSTVVDSVACMDYPLTISGICNKSGSADSATGRHTGELADAPHFRGHDSYEWADEVPGFYSVETIWADSALAAVKEMNRSDLLGEYRPEFLAAYCTERHPEFRRLTLGHYFELCGRRSVPSATALARLLRAYIRGPAMELAMRVSRRLTRRTGDVARLTGIADMASAAEAFAAYLGANGLSVDHSLAVLDRQLREARLLSQSTPQR